MKADGGATAEEAEADEPELAELNIRPREAPDAPSPQALDVCGEVASCCLDAQKRAEASTAVLAVLQGEHARLELSDMRIERLPASLSAVAPMLTHLDLSCNRLEALPQVICTLALLEELQLFGNQLTCLPDAIAGLRVLRKLQAVANRLVELPATIGQLACLEVLDVEDNALTSLPSTLGALPRLSTLRADGNPLQAPPPEVVRLGPAAVRAHFEAAPK